MCCFSWYLNIVDKFFWNSLLWWKTDCKIIVWLSYAHHYNPRFVFFYSTFPFFTAVYIVELLVLQRIYALNNEILWSWGIEFMVCNQERFQIKMVCIQVFVFIPFRNMYFEMECYIKQEVSFVPYLFWFTARELMNKQSFEMPFELVF